MINSSDYQKLFRETLHWLLRMFPSSVRYKNYYVETVDPSVRLKRYSSSILTSEEPSFWTRQVLSLNLMEDEWESEPQAVIPRLKQMAETEKDGNKVRAFIELSVALSKKYEEKGAGEQAISWYVFAAAHAYEYLTEATSSSIAQTIDPWRREIVRMYNFSVSRFIRLWQERPNPWQPPIIIETADGSYSFGVNDLMKEGLIDPNYYDDFRHAMTYEVGGLNHWYGVPGIGAAMIGSRDNSPERPGHEQYRLNQIYESTTVVLVFRKNIEDSPKQAGQGSLLFFNPAVSETIQVEAGEVPLEFDLSTPFGILLSDRNPGNNDFLDALNTSQNLDRIRFTMFERYDPERIPLLLVHGLFSSPATYIQLFNDMRGVKEIRRRYQFWMFSYPTGLPILHSAALLRGFLKQIQQEYDPQGLNPNFNQMVIVGHSMGGLLTKMMVHQPDGYLWDYYVDGEPEEMRYPPGEEGRETKKMIEEMLRYEPLPFVRRAVFIATPHRGSDIATNWIGRLGSWLTELPSALASGTSDFVRLNKDKLKIDADQLISTSPTSIDLLSPESVFIKSTAEIPIPLTHHSIIGIQNSQSGPGSTDGVVKYSGSHLDTAESEYLVPAPHPCLDHPLTIRETKRILLEHLAEMENS